MAASDGLEIGLAIGRGTGTELAGIFTKALNEIGQAYGVRPDVNRASRIYHSYHSLFTNGRDTKEIHEETIQDAAHYENFCKEQAARGVKALFRTAITAESLYMVRENLEAVKLEIFSNPLAEVILIRDLAQGFFAGTNEIAADGQSVTRRSSFRNRVFERILAYAMKRARQHWGEGTQLPALTLVYKHHLFGGLFDAWSEGWTKKYGIQIRMLQPDTMNRNILAYGFEKREIIIAGNEYADIMEVLFLDMFGKAVQENSYSENIYLAPGMNELVEYQTVHGSADDLEDKNLVNPSATLKAAASIMEHYASCKGAEKTMNNVICNLLEQKQCTKDQGGSLNTSVFVEAVFNQLGASMPSNKTSIAPDKKITSFALDQIDKLSLNMEPPTFGLQTAVVLIDFQKDFAAAVNTSSPPVSTLSKNVSRLLTHVRARSSQSRLSISSKTNLSRPLEVIHVRFFGDQQHQTAAWAHRNKTLNRGQFCISDTEGSEYVDPIQPLTTERVFTKYSQYDPFLLPEFESYLREREIEHLVIAGLYGDVCVDSTMRSAFQRGFWVSHVDGCVGMIHSRLTDWENLARNVYGARKVTVEQFRGERGGFGTPKLA